MKRQKFSREYKLEAVKQVRERGVSSAQVARDLGIGANVVSRWVREGSGDIRKAFPGQGQQPAEQAEIERLKREIVKLKAEKDILKKPRPTSRKSRVEILFRGEASRDLAVEVVVRGARCLARRLLRLAQATAERTCTPRR